MTSLPPQVPSALQNNEHFVNAYDICLGLERSLQDAVDKGEDVGRDMIFIRILGYLIHYAPTNDGLKEVADEINLCQRPGHLLDGAALLRLGNMYYDHFIRAFRANKGRISTPSYLNQSTPPSFDEIADATKATWVEIPRSDADAKRNALIRDGYRCVVTRRYDLANCFKIKELRDIISSNTHPDGGRIEATLCAHIFSDSINASIERGSPKLHHAASMWTVMRGFGIENLPEELSGSKIHRLENVMTLSVTLRFLFDQLKIWFSKTDEENKYKLEATMNMILIGYPEYVTFTTRDPVKLPVPSPVYLAIHAACAKVAHLSGAAECIDKLYQDMEKSNTLDPNGASAEMLEHAIFELQASGFEVTDRD